MAKHKVITARIVVEVSSESDDRTVGYVISALKTAFRYMKDGNVLTTIYDDKDQLLGVDMSGTPSSDLQEVFDDLVDKYEDQITVAARPKPSTPRSQGG